MPTVIDEVRAQILAFRVGESMDIDFYGERKRVKIETFDSDTVTFSDKDHNTDVLAHSDVNLVIDVPDTLSSGNATPGQPLEELLCFNLIGLSNHRLFNFNKDQIGIGPSTTTYEYSPHAGMPDSSPPLGGAVCKTPLGYKGIISPIAISSGGIPSYVISPGGVLTNQTKAGHPPQTIVLTPASNSHQVNGTIFRPQYMEAHHDKNEQVTILDT